MTNVEWRKRQEELFDRFEEIVNSERYKEIMNCFNMFMEKGHTCGQYCFYEPGDSEEDKILTAVSARTYQDELDIYDGHPEAKLSAKMKEYVEELRGLAEVENDEIAMQIEEGDVEDKYEYCRIYHSILNNADILFISDYLYDQNFDINSFYLAEIPYYEDDCTILSFWAPNGDDTGRCFDLDYNKKEHTIEPCANVWERGRGWTSIEEKSVKEAIRRSLWVTEEMGEICYWADKKGKSPKIIDNDDYKAIRDDYYKEKTIGDREYDKN